VGHNKVFEFAIHWACKVDKSCLDEKRKLRDLSNTKSYNAKKIRSEKNASKYPSLRNTKKAKNN
jgi:hypothetical protein